MNDVGAVFGIVGVAFGVILGLRWARMQSARSGYSGARAGVPKAKAARKAARGKYFIASRAALIGAIIVVAYVAAIVRGAR